MPLLLLLLLCLWTAPAWAVTYGTAVTTARTTAHIYIDNTIGVGNCANYNPATNLCAGGAATAYNDLSNAIAASAAGQVLLIRTGTYTEGAAMTLTSRTLAAYNDEAVTINGCFVLGGTAVLEDVTLQNALNDVVCDNWRYTVVHGATANGSQVRYSTITSCDTTNCAGVGVNRQSANTITQGNLITVIQGATSSGFRGYSADGTQFLDNRCVVTATTAQECVQFGSSMTNAPRCGQPMRVLRNHFSTQSSEDHLDWKGTQDCNQTIEWAYNTHDSVDSANLLIKGTPQGGHTETWLIHHNVFRALLPSDRSLSLSGQSGCDTDPGPTDCNTLNGSITNNLFLCGCALVDGILQCGEALRNDHVIQGTLTIDHNTFIDCEFIFGGFDGALRSNIFQSPRWTNAETGAVTCSHNNILTATGALDYTCTNGTAVDPTFGNAGANDYNATHASVTNSGHDGFSRGAYRELAFVAGTQAGTTGTLTFSTQGTLPLSACTNTLFDIEYDAVDATESACTPATPNTNDARLTLSAAPAATAAITAKWSYGAVSDSWNIGGPESAFQNKLKAQAVAQAVTNEATGIWVAGTQHVAPSGANRLGLLFVAQENTPATPPLNISGCTYGGQAGTEVVSVDVPDGQATGTNVIDLWRWNEAAIAAATSATFACTTTDGPQGDKPLQYVSGFFTGVNQTTPVVDSDSAIATAATTLSTSAPLTTAANGQAVFGVVAGTVGTCSALGGGFTLEFQGGEDAVPDQWLCLGRRTTAGADVTPTLTTYSVSSRLALVGASINETADIPPSDPVTRTQTASRCALHNEPLYSWLKRENTACQALPGFALLVVSQYKATGAAEPVAVGKRLQCCTDGVCDEPADWFLPPEETDNFTTQAVNYTRSDLFSTGDAIGSRLLSDPTGTFVAGTLHEDHGVVPLALAENQYSEVGHALRLSPALSGGTTVQCRLALDPNTPLEAYAAGATTQIQVVQGIAAGF